MRISFIHLMESAPSLKKRRMTPLLHAGRFVCCCDECCSLISSLRRWWYEKDSGFALTSQSSQSNPLTHTHTIPSHSIPSFPSRAEQHREEFIPSIYDGPEVASLPIPEALFTRSNATGCFIFSYVCQKGPRNAYISSYQLHYARGEENPTLVCVCVLVCIWRRTLQGHIVWASKKLFLFFFFVVVAFRPIYIFKDKRGIHIFALCRISSTVMPIA